VRTGRPCHLNSFDYIGFHRYFLTFCTNQRRDLFAQIEIVDLVHAQIVRASNEEDFAIIAYCFMPDHVHLLIQGTSERSDCKRFMTKAKQYSGFNYSQTFRDVLWQRYGYERVLREEETTVAVARYILRNPIRAGLVQDVLDYPFVGSDVYRIEQLLDSIGSSG